MPVFHDELRSAADLLASAGLLVEAETETSAPLTVRPAGRLPLADLVSAFYQVEHALGTLLSASGTVLIKDLPIRSAADFGYAAKSLLGDLAPYRERSSPRHELDDGVYTSTDYPARETIFLHNENSYQLSWPKRLAFSCLTAPASGGETPTADLRRVLEKIPDEIVQEFRQRGWMLIRNYREGLGLPWQEVFGTTSTAAVEEYCHTNGLIPEWNSDNSLRTRTTRRDVMHRHPGLGLETWFNHLAFWHVSTLPERTRNALMSLYAPEELPASTYYGDGTPIPDEVVAVIRDAYTSAQRSFRWEEGDVLLVDNMLAAHGRNPFSGPRKIAVAMS